MPYLPTNLTGLTREDHMNHHEAQHARYNADVYAGDYGSLQAAVDEGKARAIASGTQERVQIAPGIYTIDNPLILPRSGLDLGASVHLVGAGRGQTIIKGSASFPTNRALIEWDTTTARAWGQKIAHIGFQLPNVAGVKAIHYKLTDSSTYNAMNVERAQIDLIDLHIVAHNDYHDKLIKLEGIIIASTLSGLYGDPVLGTGTYDTLLLEVDSAVDGAVPGEDSDGPGLYGCTLNQLYGMVIKGGHSTVFSGRLSRSQFRDGFSNGGKTRPSFAFINSVASTLENIATEGQGEQPIFKFDHCSFMDGRNIGIGTPDAVGDNGVGNGLELIASHDCEFVNRWNAGNKPSFSSKGVKVVTIDADSKRNTFKRWGIRSGGTPANEFTIAGDSSNRIEYIDFYDNSSGVITGT
jgi:hypothetical protein